MLLVARRGVKTGVVRNHIYSAAPSGVGIAVPPGMKSFPTELVPLVRIDPLGVADV